MTTKPTGNWEKEFDAQEEPARRKAFEYGRGKSWENKHQRVKDFIRKTRQEAYTEGVMKALEVLPEPPACEENPSICGDTGCLAGEYARGVEESRVAIKALIT